MAKAKAKFDVVFTNGNITEKKGFKKSFSKCIDYIQKYRNTIYFEKYVGWSVSVMCNETNISHYTYSNIITMRSLAKELQLNK